MCVALNHRSAIVIIRRYVKPRQALSNVIQFPRNLASQKRLAQVPKTAQPKAKPVHIEAPIPAARPGSGCKFGILDTAAPTNASLRAFIAAHGLADLGYIDMPWSMGRKSNAKGAGSISPEKHYPTMNPDACRDFQWGEAFKHNCIVGFWALNGQMDLAMDMLRSQGFKAKTLVVWHKVRSLGGNACLPTRGPVQNISEILIIAQRGKGLPLCNDASKFPSVMVVERTTHSTKPGVFREVLEKLYPTTWDDRATVKLELFARSAAPGWKVWGNQAPAKVGGKAATLRV